VSKGPEANIQKAIIDWLRAKKIWHRRLNTGAIRRGGRMVRFGKPGDADLLCTVGDKEQVWLTWLEVKDKDGKQSPDQKAFQAEVEAQGHTYLVVRSVDDVINYFEG
jgi:hypothetical protein